MSQLLQLELEHNRTKLAYYRELRDRENSQSVDKWIAIYEERVRRLQAQSQAQGVRFDSKNRAKTKIGS